MRVPLRRRWARMKKTRGFAAAVCLAVFFVVLGCVWLGIERCMYPVIKTMATSGAVNQVTEAINTSVHECLLQRQLSYQDLVKVERADDGSILSLTGNTMEINALKADLGVMLADRFDRLRTEEFGIPLGTLTGWMVFSGKGPTVRIELLSVGNVVLQMGHSFKSAGINQTVHRVELEVAAVVYLMIPGEILQVDAESTVCIAETVVVGNVPETYLYLGNGEQ